MASAQNKFDNLKTYIEDNNFKTRPIYGNLTISIIGAIEIADCIGTNSNLLNSEINDIYEQHILVLNNTLNTAYPNLKTRQRQHIINSFCILNNIEYNPKRTKHIEQLSTSLDLNLILTSEMIKSDALKIDKTAILPNMYL